MAETAGAADAWEPASEVEDRMRAAVGAADPDTYFGLLARAELVVPVPAGHAEEILAGQQQPLWPLAESGGRTRVFVFTSPEAMRAATGGAYAHFLTMRFADLAEAWPDPHWWLAVNPGLPVQGDLPSWFMRQLLAGDPQAPTIGPVRPAAVPVPAAPAEQRVVEPASAPVPEQVAEKTGGRRRRRAAVRAPAGFTPAVPLERELLAAVAKADDPAYFAVLDGAEVLVPVSPGTDTGAHPGRPGFPWQTAEVDGVPVTAVFTSPERLAEAGVLEFVRVPFAAVLRHWPDTSWTLLVNPGGAVGASLPGTEVALRSERIDQRAAEAATAAFEPQNELEERLRDAGDAAAFHKALSASQVLVPVHDEVQWGTPPDDPAFPWAPVPLRGRPGLLVFTSLKWMHEAIGQSRFVMPEAAELMAAWPGPDLRLVVNPGGPVGTVLTGEQVAALAGETPRAVEAPHAPEPLPEATPETVVEAVPEPVAEAVPDVVPEAVPEPEAPAAPPEVPDFEAGNRIDQELFEASIAGDTDTFLRILFSANVLVPIPQDAPLELPPTAPGFRWDAALRDPASVQVFTSLVRLKESLGTGDPAARFVYADFRDLIGGWPDGAWAMLLNPGTRIGASLGGDQVTALGDWAGRVGLLERSGAPGQPAVEEPGPEQAPVLEEERPVEPLAAVPEQEPEFAPEPLPGPESLPEPAGIDEPAGPLLLQKVLAPGHVSWYLDQGYDRVGGFVHPAEYVADLRVPTQIYEALGLLYEDSPFTTEDDGAYVIRWPAHCADLYRIPFGGQTEQELQGWGEEGWVVERAPFQGAGFAPGSAGTIREYKVDSVRLPYGAEMYYLGRDRSEVFIAMYDPDRLEWVRPGDVPAAGWNGSPGGAR